MKGSGHAFIIWFKLRLTSITFPMHCLFVVLYNWYYRCCPNNSFAHEISAVIYKKIQRNLKSKIICLTGKDTHVAYTKSLEDLFYPTETEIFDVIERISKIKQ